MPLSVADRTRSTATSMNVVAPGSVQRKVTSVIERNVPSPGPPVPSVRSSAMSYAVTSSRRARSAASIWVRLRTPATLPLLVVARRITPMGFGALFVNASAKRVFHDRHLGGRRQGRSGGV